MFPRAPETLDEEVKWQTQGDDADCPESYSEQVDVFILACHKIPLKSLNKS